MSTRIKGDINNGSYLYIDYTIGAPNVAGNYTEVTWTAGVHFGTYYFNIHDAVVTMSTTVSGATVSKTTTTGTYNSGWPISGAGPNMDHAFKSGTTRVNHNPAGAGNIKFVGSANWDTPSNFTSNFSITVALASIAKVPSAPAAPAISAVLPTSVIATWTPPAANGAAITGYDIGFATTSAAPVTISTGTSPQTITGLLPGTKYYFWVRAKNSVGTGTWSPSSNAMTLAGAHINVAGTWKLAIPYVNVAGTWKMAIPWVRDGGTWKETT